MENLMILRLFVILCSVYEIKTNPSSCGKWQAYKNEKCFEILDKEKFFTFEDGIKACSQFDNSSELLTIQTKEEEIFISNYLFKVQKLVDNIWLGFRKINGRFEWINSSKKQYDNWKIQNPINDTDFNCTQIDTHSEWSNESCLKKNLVVCQKNASLNLEKKITRLEEEIKEIIDDFKITKEELNSTKKELELCRKKPNGFSNVLSNGKVSFLHMFTDTDGKDKAFLIPLIGMTHHTFDDSVKICKSLNSTLVEIESKEKQLILESFLKILGPLSEVFSTFKINAIRDSTSGKFLWIESNRVMNFTNWDSDEPSSDNDHVYVRALKDSLGKWSSTSMKTIGNLMCEYTFKF